MIFGNHDEKTLAQMEAVKASGAEHTVLCADGHLGYSHPIGGVAAYRDKISLSGVGFDIGCGNTAVRTNLKGEQVRPRIAGIMDIIFDKISFGVGQKRGDGVEYHRSTRAALDLEIDSGSPFARGLRQLAHDQLGTVGSGNHYVDIFVEEATDDVWIGVHFGSRGFGHKIATHYMQAIGAKDDMMSPPALLEADSDVGRAYIRDMRIAGRYASFGRNRVIGTLYKILDADPTFYVNNHHNYCWREEHFGEQWWVVRKGATPARPGQLGFIGGSMGDDAVIVEGVESSGSAAALYSTIHGAGRVMSRRDAKGKVAKDGRVIREPRVDRYVRDAWIANRGVEVRGGDLDEAPQAYRRLPDVLAAHGSTIRVLHTLRPIGVAMAGADVRDPYKD